MLNLDLPPSDALIPMTDEERILYEQVVPEDHFLRRLQQAVDFLSLRPLLAGAYSPDQGRPPLDPVLLLKLEVLARQYRLSDREVIAAARFHLAYRLFLGLSLKSPLPHPTSLTYFRQRLGPERMQQLFDALVGQARRLGLVQDRLRLKDATHIIANIAVPSTIRLVAETRDHLLDAVQPFAPARAAEEAARAEAIRLGTLLAIHPVGAEPPTFALLALMHLHAARLASRQDAAAGMRLPSCMPCWNASTPRRSTRSTGRWPWRRGRGRRQALRCWMASCRRPGSMVTTCGTPSWRTCITAGETQPRRKWGSRVRSAQLSVLRRRDRSEYSFLP